ncbi:small heat shock protein [Pleurotus eryngii]|uniref:Small heat shock protein n=1 Tax=Pleurotus eryngii TaxID=5323 RepID=A0A9P5ZYT9_PLEER|nr:small heat shock protein [Pleurotus eryngii]
MSSSLFFYEPFAEFDRLFDEAFNTRTGNPSQRQISRQLAGVPNVQRPRMDLHEDTQQNAVTASFELPGFKKEDVNVDVHNGRLIVSAESNTSAENKADGYAVRERRFGKFSRTLQLPQGIKDENIKASMQDGVLTVTFPKSAPELAPKKINIS